MTTQLTAHVEVLDLVAQMKAGELGQGPPSSQRR